MEGRVGHGVADGHHGAVERRRRVGGRVGDEVGQRRARQLLEGPRGPPGRGTVSAGSAGPTARARTRCPSGEGRSRRRARPRSRSAGPRARAREVAVGRVVADSQVAREDLFITSKLFLQSSPYAQYGKDIDATLECLGTDYVDLLLLHQPYGEYVSGRRAMGEAVEAGRVRSIGLSSFSATLVREILDWAAWARPTATGRSFTRSSHAPGRVIPRGAAAMPSPSACQATRRLAVPTPSPGPWAVRSGPRRRPDGPPGAAAPRKVITPRTFSPPRRPARAAEPRNHADSHRVRGCWPA
ncbi:aldo/keto reductase [Actinomyces israelii]|uniref:aldo/keto reductase n=1 Tax=Actinomyces israelii TaxID=1659 RepID=UPI00399D5EBB